MARVEEAAVGATVASGVVAVVGEEVAAATEEGEMEARRSCGPSNPVHTRSTIQQYH